MAKYLLIIDVNDELLEDYENFYVDYDLRAERKNENVNESIKYVEGCPLKPIPEKRHNNGGDRIIGFYDSEFDDGYNACLEEILGEEDDG